MSRETNQDFDLPLSDPAHRVLSLIADGAAKYKSHGDRRYFVQLQLDNWIARRTKIEQWAARPQGRPCPGNGKFNAWSIAYIINDLATQIGIMDDAAACESSSIREAA